MKTVTFYVLLGLKDLEFLDKNNFTVLPFNEILFTFKKEDIEKYAETSIKHTDNILITARVECGMDRFTEYRGSHSDENSAEFGGLSEIKTNTLNHSLIDKIKIENVFGKNFQNADNEKILSILEFEESFFCFRLRTFLNTNSKDVIPADYFDKPTDNFINEENDKKLEKIVKEQRSFENEVNEITSKINTVEEAVDFLINEDLNKNDFEEIKNKSVANQFEDTVEHFGYGMYLRNLFIYPNENKVFLENLKNYEGHYVDNFGEFGEGIIGDLLWRKINNFETTEQNCKKIKEIQERIDRDSHWDFHIKMKLLSYNFTEDEIEQHLKLQKKMDDNNDNFEEYYFQQKALLARLNKEEKETFENIKQDYFNIQNVVERLKQKP